MAVTLEDVRAELGRRQQPPSGQGVTLEAVQSELARRQASDVVDRAEERRSPTLASFVPGLRLVQDIQDIAEQGFERTEQFPFFRLPSSVGERAEREQRAQQAIAGFAAPAAGALAGVARAAAGGAGILGRAGASALGTGAGDIAAQFATKGEVDPVQAGISTGLGAVGQPVGEALAAGVSGVRALGSELLASRIPSFARNRAQQAVTQALARGGQTPREAGQAIRGLQQTGAPARLADVGGEPVQALTERVAKSPSRGADLLRDAFDNRQKLQLRRLSAQLRLRSGTKVRDIEDAVLESQASRAAASAPLYDEAFSAPVPQSLGDDFADLTKTGFGKQAAQRARKTLQTEFNVDDVSEVPVLNRIDATKRELDDMIGAARRAGENNRARLLTDVKNKMVRAADDAVPAYAAARNAWAGPAAWQDAVENGLSITKAEMTPAKLRQLWAGFTESEKQGYRIGAVQRLVDQMGEQAADLPNLTKLLGKQNLLDKFKIIMPGGKGEIFEQAIKAERQLAETGIRARGGSRTAGLQATDEALSREDTVIDAMADLFQGDFRGALSRTLRLPTRLKAKIQEKRNEEIARILLSQDPTAALKPQAGAPVAQPLGPTAGVPTTAGLLGIQDLAQ